MCEDSNRSRTDTHKSLVDVIISNNLVLAPADSNNTSHHLCAQAALEKQTLAPVPASAGSVMVMTVLSLPNEAKSDKRVNIRNTDHNKDE